MRKHDVRKWLHAVLDLLPVILIPVFMIYSHRHTIDSGSIQVSQNQVLDFNQYVYDGDIEKTLEFSSQEYEIRFNMHNVESDNQICLIKSYFELSSNTSLALGFTDNTTQTKYDFREWQSVGAYHYYRFTCDKTEGYTYCFLRSLDSASFGVTASMVNCQFFNLTKTFGYGNEPSIEQFNAIFNDDYYEYTLSKKVLIKDVSTITYDDSDIMSQVVYQLYNSVDKYFNMGNVFNMTGVYDWFNLNIFNGNAPISIYIVWNIVLYEFVMDLLFLLYGLFMWFIDMVEKIMDKPFKSIK